MPQIRPEDVRRTIVLMVDDLGLSFESMAFVRSSLRKFVEKQMQAGDLVAVCRTAAGSGALQQFTADKRVLLSIIDGLRWNPNGRYGVSLFEPYGKYGKTAAMTPTSGDSRSWDVAYNGQRNTIFTVGTLGAVSYIVGALREMPGRKSIVLFSDGISLFTEAQGSALHRGGEAGFGGMQTNTDVLEALRKLVDLANRAGTVIYTMHTMGLQPLVPSAEDRVELGGFNNMGGQQRQKALKTLMDAGTLGGRDVEFNVGQQGLAHLALETGGLAYENGNDLNWGLDRVLEDQQGYYLLGYKPSEQTFVNKHGSRSYHRIQVKVKRAGLQVRSRTGFFGETDEESRPRYNTPIEQMRAAMLSPFQSSGVRLRLTALYAEVPKVGPVVRNLLHINAQDLDFHLAADGSATARVGVVAVATGTGDVALATVARSYQFQIPAGRVQEALKNGALYTIDVPVKKRGAYQIRVAVRDEATAKVGSASQFIEIPDLKKVRMALTSVVLEDGERPPGTSGLTGMTAARRQFRRGGQVEYICLVQKGGKKGPDPELDSQIRVVRDGKDVYSGPAKVITVEGGGRAVAGKLKLGEAMTPGDYYLQVMAKDRRESQKGVSAQWTDFEVLP
jgi:VWFA-related protein